MQDLISWGGSLSQKVKILLPAGWYWVTTYANEFSYHVANEGYVDTIEYALRVDVGASSFSVSTQHFGSCTIKLRTVPRLILGGLPPSGVRSLTANLDLDVTISSTLPISKSLTPGPPTAVPDATFHHQVITSPSTVTRGPSVESQRSSSELYELIHEPRPHHFGGYKTRHDAIAAGLHRLFLGAIRPTATLSTHDAISKETDVIKANHLETLKEFGEVLSFIPDVLGLIRTFYDASKGRADSHILTKVVDMGTSLFDLFANANLLFSFGGLPTYAAAAEIVEMLDPLLSKLRTALGGPRTLYGKFNWTFPDDPLGYPMRLTTRSKIRVRFDAETALFSALSSARYLGLLPTSSNLWDLIPWSFAIDSVANVGGRLDVLDRHSQLLGLKFLYGLHSFTFSGDYPDNVLQPFGLHRPASCIGNSLPGFTYYVREFSLYVPSPKLSSRGYDFKPPHFMSWGNIGSLVYTRL